MKKILIVIALLIFMGNAYSQDQKVKLPNGKTVVLHPDKTWEYYEGLSYNFDFSKLKDNSIPDLLRQGIIVKKGTLKVAVEMSLQGWNYTMPRPKSAKAAWGKSDGRTTWWNGHWYNSKTKKYSRGTPKKQSNGYYYGDEQNNKGTWRNGGSPNYPSKIEWLLSTSGGVRPY